jgi:hypothetical protein
MMMTGFAWPGRGRVEACAGGHNPNNHNKVGGMLVALIMNKYVCM